MNINEIKKIVTEQTAKMGYVFEDRKSSSTNSWYFKLYATPDISLLFRVSDHVTNKNVITLRVDHKTSRKDIERFVYNRCRDLSYRKVKAILGL